MKDNHYNNALILSCGSLFRVSHFNDYYAKCRCTECRILVFIMLNVVVLSVIMLSVVAPNKLVHFGSTAWEHA